MEIMLFSKWRRSAVLNLQKLQFWSRDLYRHVIHHLCSIFRVDRPIWLRDRAKKRFSIWRPSVILNLHNFDFFVKCSSCELRCTSVYQIYRTSRDKSRFVRWYKLLYKPLAKVIGKGHFRPPQRRNPLTDLDHT